MTNYWILFSFIFLFYGCAASLVKLNLKPGDAAVVTYQNMAAMWGAESAVLGDSLVPAWESGLNGSNTLDGVIAAGNYLFVSDLSGRILCFDRFTGKQRGILRYKGVIPSAPVLDGYLLVFPVLPLNENCTWLTGYDVFNGAEVFKVRLNGRVNSILLLNKNRIFALSEEGAVYKLDLKGTLLQSTSTGAFTLASPALGRVLVFGNNKGELVTVDTASVKVIGRFRLSSRPLHSPTILGDTVFVAGDGGKLFALNPLSGEAYWSCPLQAAASMAPAVAGGRVFIGDRAGNLYGVGQDGTLRWHLALGGVLVTPPLVTADKLLVPDLNYRLHCISRTSGKLLRTLEFEGRVKHTPLLTDSLLYIGFDPGIVKAYYAR